MPRFFMHICNGTGFVEDEEGAELADLEAARAQAVKSAREIMADDLRKGELDLTSFIEVEDEQHEWLFTITFAEAVQIKARYEKGNGASD